MCSGAAALVIIVVKVVRLGTAKAGGKLTGKRFAPGQFPVISVLRPLWTFTSLLRLFVWGKLKPATKLTGKRFLPRQFPIISVLRSLGTFASMGPRDTGL